MLQNEILIAIALVIDDIAMMSVIWAVNELLAWLGKKKSKSRW